MNRHDNSEGGRGGAGAVRRCGKRWSRTLAGVLVAVVLSMCAQGARGQVPACITRLDVEAPVSTLSIGGSVLSPLTVPIQMANESQAGVLGALFLEALTPDGSCPENLADLLAQSPETTFFRFIAPPEGAADGSLSVYPPKMDVAVRLGTSTIADLSFTNVGINLLSENFTFALSPGSGGEEAADQISRSANFTTRVLFQVAEGTIATRSIVLGAGTSYMDGAGLNTTADMSGVLNFEESKIVLSSPISASFDIKDGDIAAGVTASVVFEIDPVSQGYYGCDEECIIHGKCVAVDANSTSGTACLCECGWSGPNCEVAGGYCSAFPTNASSIVLYESTPATWGDAGNQTALDKLLSAAACEDVECPVHSFLNEDTCGCDCQVNWLAPSTNCSLCENNAACVIAEAGSECDTSLVYTNKTLEKNYVCNLREDDPLKEFVEGDIRVLCDVEAGNCTLRIGSLSDSDPHVVCSISQCTFTLGSADVMCDYLDCDCHPDLGCPEYISQEIVDIMRDATGIKAGVLCSKDGPDWVCVVDIDDLPITIAGVCIQGTCLDGRTTDSVVSALSNVSPPGLMLALAGILGGLLLALLVFFLSTHFWRMKLKAILAKHGRVGGAAVSNYLLPGSVFTFNDVTCSLAMVQPTKSSANSAGPFGGVRNFFKKKRGDANAVADSTQASMRDSADSGPHHASHCSLEKLPSGNFVNGGGSPIDDSSVELPNSAETEKAFNLSESKFSLSLNEYDKKGKTRTILHSVTGSLQRGSVMAIMGPSGSGKSTLLNILAGGGGQISNCNVSGTIQVDGQKRNQWFHKIAGHVPQEDNQIPTLTVRECIAYSAMLRLPWHWSRKTKMAHVDQVLKELGLSRIAHSQVGGSAGIRGVSGGEKRRVSIGMELVTSPKILFLDEPTSGLDSFTAASIMATLTKLARNGRMVFVSLHQPSEAVFRELDKILLLARGHPMYCGDAAKVEKYFANKGFPCPTHCNIADHVLEVISKPEAVYRIINSEETSKVAKSRAPAPAKHDTSFSFGNHPNSMRALQPSENLPVSVDVAEDGNDSARVVLSARKQSRELLCDVEMTPTTQAMMDLSPGDKGELVDADAHQPLDRELLILFWRAWTDTTRHPALLRLHVIVSILVGCASAIIFANVPADLAGLQNRAGCIFFTLTFFAFGSLTSIDLFIAERTVFAREYRGSYYKIGTYFFSKAVLDGLLLRVLPAVLYSVIVYWAIGLRSGASHVMVFFATLALFNLAAGALAMLITVVSPTAGFAGLATIVVLLISLLFGGFLANAEALPAAIGWLQYLSIFYYGFEILFVNEVHGLTVEFDAAGLNVNVKGDLFLDTFNFSEDDLPRDIVCLFAIYVGVLIIAYLLLWLVHGKTDVKVKEVKHKKKKRRTPRLKWFGKKK